MKWQNILFLEGHNIGIKFAFWNKKPYDVTYYLKGILVCYTLPSDSPGLLSNLDRHYICQINACKNLR